MNRQRKIMGIVASVVLAAVGTAILVTYVRSAQNRAVKGEKTVGVLVATRAIPKGTRSEDVKGMVKMEQVPAKVVLDGTLASLGTVTGQVTTLDLVPGEQLARSRFASAAAAGQATVSPGSLSVTVAMDALRALGGRVRAGDSVGVLASFDDPETTRLILQKVPVTDVRTELGVAVTGAADGAAAAGATGRLFVTLAVGAPSVERVVFAAEHGRLWLSWEPKEASEGGTVTQTRNGVNQ